MENCVAARTALHIAMLGLAARHERATAVRDIATVLNCAYVTRAHRCAMSDDAFDALVESALACAACAAVDPALAHGYRVRAFNHEAFAALQDALADIAHASARGPGVAWADVLVALGDVRGEMDAVLAALPAHTRAALLQACDDGVTGAREPADMQHAAVLALAMREITARARACFSPTRPRVSRARA